MTSNEIKLEDQTGIVGYWEDIQKYTINFSIPNTIDSSVTGIVDDLPEAYRESGLKVTFSGKLQLESGNPRPMFGGQRVYSLKLSTIEKQ